MLESDWWRFWSNPRQALQRIDLGKFEIFFSRGRPKLIQNSYPMHFCPRKRLVKVWSRSEPSSVNKKNFRFFCRAWLRTCRDPHQSLPRTKMHGIAILDKLHLASGKIFGHRPLRPFCAQLADWSLSKTAILLILMLESDWWRFGVDRSQALSTWKISGFFAELCSERVGTLTNRFLGRKCMG